MGNTFIAKYWDGLAGIAMISKGGFEGEGEGGLMERVRISNFEGESLMNRRNEMGGIRVERTQYRRWGGGQ